jgi:hypothetical protein
MGPRPMTADPIPYRAKCGRCEWISAETAGGELIPQVDAMDLDHGLGYCENADCGNPLALEDVAAADGLCSYCAEREDLP